MASGDARVTFSWWSTESDNLRKRRSSRRSESPLMALCDDQPSYELTSAMDAKSAGR